jgi:glycosyltransferase involved in cell wall biosynthesis
MAAETADDCTVVIPAYRAESTIGRTLASLIGQGVARVIVVASPGDQTADHAEAFARACGDPQPYQLDVVRSPVRLSAGAARNLGRHHAGTADWLLFLDADTALEDGAFFMLFREAFAERLDAAAASVHREGSGLTSRVRHALEFKEAEGRGPLPQSWRLPSTALLVRASAFDAVSGFPDGWPGEDLVFDYDLEHSGAERRFVRKAQVRHLHPEGVVEMLRHQRRLGRTAAWARMHRPLSGSSLTSWVRRPSRASFGLRLLFVWLLVPVRLWRGIFWYARFDPRSLPALLLALPLWIAGCCSWTRGFVAEVRERGRVIRSCGGDAQFANGRVAPTVTD